MTNTNKNGNTVSNTVKQRSKQKWTSPGGSTVRCSFSISRLAEARIKQFVASGMALNKSDAVEKMVSWFHVNQRSKYLVFKETLCRKSSG